MRRLVSGALNAGSSTPGYANAISALRTVLEKSVTRSPEACDSCLERSVTPHRRMVALVDVTDQGFKSQ